MKKLLLACAAAGSLLAIAVHWASATVSPITYVGNVAYQILNSDKTIVPNAALTANRTWTLPYAAGTNLTGSLDIIDAQGVIGGSNSCIVIAPQTGDLINGSSASITFCSTYGKISLFPISGTAWSTATNGVSPGQNPGTATNDNASAGNVGEVISSITTLGSAVQLTTNSAAQLATVSLTPGDWDCRATMSEAVSAATTVQQVSAGVSQTNSLIGTQGTDGVTLVEPASAISTHGNDLKMGPVRESLAGITSIYLVGSGTFSTSQLWAYGSLTCRRAR